MPRHNQITDYDVKRILIYRDRDGFSWERIARLFHASTHTIDRALLLRGKLPKKGVKI